MKKLLLAVFLTSTAFADVAKEDQAIFASKGTPQVKFKGRKYYRAAAWGASGLSNSLTACQKLLKDQKASRSGIFSSTAGILKLTYGKRITKTHPFSPEQKVFIKNNPEMASAIKPAKSTSSKDLLTVLLTSQKPNTKGVKALIKEHAPKRFKRLKL